jgi:hypothetical protein
MGRGSRTIGGGGMNDELRNLALALGHNPERREQKIPKIWVQKSREFAEGMILWYASENGRNSRSRSVSGPWGAERDPKRQMNGKIGEVATALFFELDPADAINWNAEKDGDGNVDVLLSRSKFKLDVKTNSEKRPEMYSSMAVNQYYHQKQFDAFVSVSLDFNFDRDERTSCFIEGWITKREFFETKKIAAQNNSRGLTAGTWFVEKIDLQPIDRLLLLEGYKIRVARQANRERKVFEFVIGQWP